MSGHERRMRRFRTDGTVLTPREKWLCVRVETVDLVYLGKPLVHGTRLAAILKLIALAAVTVVGLSDTVEPLAASGSITGSGEAAFREPRLSPAGIEASDNSVAARRAHRLPELPILSASDGQSAHAEVTLFSTSLRWQVSPAAQATAELLRSGDLVGRADGRAGDDGSVMLWLSPVGPPDEPPERPFVVVLPGDVLLLAEVGGSELRITVPQLLGELEPVGDTLAGKAPPGTVVDVTLREGPGVPEAGITRTVEANSFGDWNVDLSGVVDIAPGQSGTARISDVDGHRFTAHVAVFDAVLTLDAGRVEGRGTPGGAVLVEIEDSNGAAEAASEILNGVLWEVPDPGVLPRRRLPTLAAGDLVTVTYTSQILAPRVISTTVPPLSVVVDEGASEVRGDGPADSDLVVEIANPGREEVSIPVHTDQTGAYRVDLALEGVEIASGSAVTVILGIGTELQVRAVEVLAEVLIWVHDSTVSGHGAPGGAVTATLFAADGTEQARGSTRATQDGSFALGLGVGLSTPAISPADRVEVEFSQGDPLLFDVPELHTETDPETNVVSGSAPPDAEVAVVGGSPEAPVTVNVNADDTGRFRADFSAVLDIEPPDGGYVAVLGSRRLLYVTGWAPPRLSLTFSPDGPPTIRLTGAHGLPAALTIVDVDGLVLRSEEGRTSLGQRLGGFTRWTVAMQDETGAPLVLVPGDEILGRVGRDEATLVVPPLDVWIDVEDDSVSGVTAPNSALELVVRDHWTDTAVLATLLTGSDGHFRHEFGADLDLLYLNRVAARVVVGRHLVTHEAVAPGLSLDLDLGVASGSTEPGVDVRGELLGPSGLRATGRATAGPNRLFVMPLVDRAGEPAEPEPGDRLVVTAPEARATNEITMNVPELTLVPDPRRDAVAGRATPGGRISIGAEARYPFPEWGRELTGGVAPDIGIDGVYSGVFASGVDLEPGWRLRATYWSADGQSAVRTRHVPIANVQIDGAHVCGFGEPGAPVTAELVDGVRSIQAQTSGMVNRAGNYDLSLRDDRGHPVPVRFGSIVSVTIGTERVVVPVPMLDLAVDWTSFRIRITGHGPPDARWSASAPVSDCFSNVLQNGGGGGLVGVTDAGGNLEGELRFIGVNGRAIITGDPGEGLEVVLWQPDGHRTYKQVFRTLARIFVDTDRVTGLTTPFDDVTISVNSVRDGSGRGTAVAAPDGTFEVRSAADGLPFVIRPGYVVTTESSQGAFEILVEPLAFDVSPTQGVIGQALPRRQVALRLELGDGRRVRAVLSADDSGRFAYGPADISPRATWAFDDVLWAEVSVTTSDGHEIVAEARLDEAQNGRLFVPVAVTRP